MPQMHTAYLKWRPQPDITPSELSLAMPILTAMESVEFVSIPPLLTRHFAYGPLVGWRDAKQPS